jgi:nucleoid DNA-binding protein
MFRIGIGHDTHRLGAGDALVIGGIRIPHDKTAIGHSDADVLLHAITDALLGAAALGDIGEMFPDSDPANEGRDSADMLRAGPTISKKDCARVVDAFLDAIKEALQEQKNIEVRGFGTFKIRQRKTRMARNPRTGSPVEVSARPVPVFKPSKELRAMVAGVDESMLEDEDGDELNDA